MDGNNATPADRASSPAYPLKAGPNKRYLADQNNVPCLVHGDTAWSIIVGLTETEVEQYLENRQRKGFNSILVNLIEHYYNGPRTRTGDGPFSTPGDFSTPNERYFAHADWVIKKAAEHGIQVFLTPLYLGARDEEGWIVETLANGPAACHEYGRYLGRRYAGGDNIIWVMGGDRTPGPAGEHVDALAQGIKEYDQRHMFTAHCRPDISPLEQLPRHEWLDLNVTYTYEIVHRKLLADYRRTPTMPFILLESSYEGEHNTSDVQVRRQAYWALLCGATGHIFGNNPIWPFNAGWQEAMDAAGSRSMVHLRRLFDSRAWYDLVPDLDGTYTFVPDLSQAVVTGGRGEFRGLDYLAAACTRDGGTMIAYMPTRRAITVDLSRLSGNRVKGWWYDPRTGKTEPAGEFGTAGFQDLTPPGEGDWVLVMDDTSRNMPAPGAG